MQVFRRIRTSAIIPVVLLLPLFIGCAMLLWNAGRKPTVQMEVVGRTNLDGVPYLIMRAPVPLPGLVIASRRGQSRHFSGMVLLLFMVFLAVLFVFPIVAIPISFGFTWFSAP